MKNYHLDLIRVTENGAIAAAQWVGQGNKEAADKAASDAIRARLNQLEISAIIDLGEGIKDNSHGLFQGEEVGLFRDKEPEYSIVLDPVEGTTPVSRGGNEAMSVIALGNKDAFYKTDLYYMNKLAVGPRVKNMTHLDIRDSVKDNVMRVAMALNKTNKDVTVCVLDRPRHQYLIDQLRIVGCKIKLIADCDVSACIATCFEDSGIDMYMGIGGSPEAVLAAAAIKCLGGIFQAQLYDVNTKMIDHIVLGIEDLAKGEVMFCGTGITSGMLLRGVEFTSKGTVTHSIAMRSESGTVRRITTNHGN